MKIENGEWRMENSHAVQLIFIAACIFFFSCSPNFTQTHKLYKEPVKSERVSFTKLGDAFMLTRAAWFAEKLSLNNDSIYGQLGNLTDSIIQGELSKRWNISTIAANKRESFSRETLKMDKTIFIKTRFPEQGMEIASDNGEVPDYIFIIHEYTVGGDLNAENFYDYTKANLEMAQTKKIKDFSIIATWTLWDNKRQIPLRSSVASVQIPLKDDFIDMNLFINAIKAVVGECLGKL